MAVTISGDDFTRMDQNYQAGLDHKDRLNRRRRESDVMRAGIQMPQNPNTQPFGYEGQQQPVTRQMGPTPEQIAAQKAAEAQQAAQQQAEQQAPVTPGLNLPNRQGTMGAEGIDQIQPDSTAPGQWIEGQSAGMDVSKALQQIKTKTATGGYDNIPATSPFARGWAWLTKAANDPYHANQAGAKVMTDWVRTPEFDALIRNDPNRIAEFNADPMGFHQKYAGQKAAPAVPEDRGVSDWKPVPPSKIEPGSGRNTGLYDMIQYQESRNDPNAVNPKTGAFGLMQLMPDTAAKPGFGVTPLRDDSPEENRRFGEDYFEAMLNRYGGNMSAALTAYNWGPGKADAWMAYGADPAELPEETRNYVTEIMTNYGGEPFGEDRPAVGAAPQQVAGVQTEALPGEQEQITIRNSGQTKKGGLKESPTGPAEELAVSKNPTKTAPPKSNLSFTLRSDQMQALMQQRQSLIRKAKLDAYIQGAHGGGIETLSKTRELIATHDIMIGSMAKKQAIDLLSNNNDPRMLNQLLSRQSGRQVEYGPNDDGTWYERVDGQITVPSMSLSNITSVQTNAADKAHYDAMKQAAVGAKSEKYKMQLEASLKIQVQNAADNNTLEIEGVKGSEIVEKGNATYMKDIHGKWHQIVMAPGMDGGPEQMKLIPVSAATGAVSSYQTGG